MSPFHFPSLGLLHCFVSSSLLSHFWGTKFLFIWHFLPFPPIVFLLPPTQFSPEVTKAAHWAVSLLSVECKTCTVGRSSAYEILFRTVSSFCKLLYMVKILVCSFGGGEKNKKHYLWKAESYPNWKTRQLLVRKAGRIIFTACIVAVNSCLPFSLSDP